VQFVSTRHLLDKFGISVSGKKKKRVRKRKPLQLSVCCAGGEQEKEIAKKCME